MSRPRGAPPTAVSATAAMVGTLAGVILIIAGRPWWQALAAVVVYELIGAGLGWVMIRVAWRWRIRRLTAQIYRYQRRQAQQSSGDQEVPGA